MELEILPVLIIFEFILSNILKSTVPFTMLSSLLPLFERALLVLNAILVTVLVTGLMNYYYGV